MSVFVLDDRCGAGESAAREPAVEAVRHHRIRLPIERVSLGELAGAELTPEKVTDVDARA